MIKTHPEITPKRKVYTAWRRFLAWVGFITIVFGIPIALYFVVWAHSFLSNN